MKKLFSVIIIIVTFFLGGIKMIAAQQPPPILQTGQTITPASPPGQAPPSAKRTEQTPSTGQAIPQLNTLNISKVIEVAREARKYFTPGRVWTYQTPGGEVIIKAAILYQGVAVGALEFNPVDGSILPRGYHPHVFNPVVSLEIIKQKLPSIISNLNVLSGAEYREPEYCWAVPLSFEGKIVTHIKVYYDGIHIVPDYPTLQEMQAFGR